MPLNDKINSLISEQCDTVEERCTGYREKLIGLIHDIIREEKEHRISRTKVQKKIDNRFNTVAQFLAEARQSESDA